MTDTALRDAAVRRDRWRQRWTSRHIDVAVTVGIFVVAALVITFFRREPVFSDDLGYWDRENRVGESTGMANHYRIAMVLSTYFAKLMFGQTLTAYHSVGVVYGAGLVAALYVLTRLLFPRPVAIGASLLLLTSPLFLQDAALLLPDWPSMFWFVSGMALLVFAATRADTSRRRILAAIAAGACFFVTLWTKEATVGIFLAVPICLALVAGWRRGLTTTAIAAGSSIVLAIGEFGLLWMLFGDPFRRLDVVLGGHVANRTSERLGGDVESTVERVTESAGAAAPAVVDRTTLADWWELADRYIEPISQSTPGRITLALIIVTIIVTVFARDRRLWFFTTLMIVGLGFVMFMVGSINPLTPMLGMKFRYLSLGWVFVMPLITAATWITFRWFMQSVDEQFRTCDSAPRAWTRPATTSAMIAGVLAVSTMGVADVADEPIFVEFGEDGLQQAVDAIERLEDAGTPVERIVTDGRTRQALTIAADDELHELIWSASTDFGAVRPGDLVVLNRKRIGRATHPGRGSLTAQLDPMLLFPPLHWELMAQTEVSNLRVYFVREPLAEAPQPATLASTGVDVTGSTHAFLVNDTAHVATQRADNGSLLLFAEGATALRFVTGARGYTQPPRGRYADELSVTAPGRIGVRVDLHRASGVAIEGLYLYTYDHDGAIASRSRMVQAIADDRTSEIAFLTPESMHPTSWMDSVDVDPATHAAFRIVGYASGTGIITLDRVAVDFLPAQSTP